MEVPLKRAVSIIIGATNGLERKEFHSMSVEDRRGKQTNEVYYRVGIVDRTILVQECNVKPEKGKGGKAVDVEVVSNQWAFVNRDAEITFDVDDPEEDEDSEGFDLLFGITGDGEGDDDE
jgi:hypothetical protein